MHGRSRTGYQHKKIFGPSDTRSNAGDSFHGYDDSYHSTDSRRSALPPPSYFGGSVHGGRMTRNTSFASLEVRGARWCGRASLARGVATPLALCC